MGNTECSSWCSNAQEQPEIPDTLEVENEFSKQANQNTLNSGPEHEIHMEADSTEDHNFSCTDFEWETHKPSSSFAIEIPKKMQLDFLPPKVMRIQYERLKNINIKVNDLISQLPSNEEPYLIPSLKRIYIGQWKHGQPYGIGKMIYLEANSNIQQKEETWFLNNVASQEEKEFVQKENIIAKNDTHQVPNKQLSLNTKNLISRMQHQVEKQVTEEEIKQFSNSHIIVNFYEGEIRNAKAQGKGRLLTLHLTFYEGYFREDKFHGEGLLKKADGFVYSGQFQNHMPCGRGTETYPDKTTYFGQYKNGKKHGQGQMRFPIKDRKYIEINNNKKDNQDQLYEGYDGEFQNNKFHGEGVYKWPDGRKYEGSFVNGSMQGHGTFTWPNKQKYVGEYFDDLKHGNGKFYWANGTYWDGNWNYGVMHGLGIIYVPIKEPKNNEVENLKKKDKSVISKKKVEEEPEQKYKEIYGHWEKGVFTTCYLPKKFSKSIGQNIGGGFINLTSGMTNIAGNIGGGLANVAGGVGNMTEQLGGSMGNMTGSLQGNFMTGMNKTSDLIKDINIMKGFKKGKEINIEKSSIKQDYTEESKNQILTEPNLNKSGLKENKNEQNISQQGIDQQKEQLNKSQVSQQISQTSKQNSKQESQQNQDNSNALKLDIEQNERKQDNQDKISVKEDIKDKEILQIQEEQKQKTNQGNQIEQEIDNDIVEDEKIDMISPIDNYSQKSKTLSQQILKE